LAKIPKRPEPSPRADWWARIPAYIALALSGLSFLFAYESGLPSLAAKVEFVNPIVAGENFNFKIDIDNNGNTTAKHIHPDLRFGWALATVEFKPFGPGMTLNATPPEWKPTVSDLGPKGHTTIFTANPINFADDKTVNGVIAGKYKFYVFGRIPYEDVLHVGHEFHLCFYYIQNPGLDPLKLVMCPSYNETD
jgi:hypothetical protein